MSFPSDGISLERLADIIPYQTMLGVHFSFAPDHCSRLKIVEAAIDFISTEYTKNRHLKQLKHDDVKKSEDEITIDIVMSLKMMGFNATHDTQYGGHCDIAIETNDGFLWIAEAKIHSGYDWLLSGFEQLDRRYSTGIAGQNAGEILIYCYQQNSIDVLKNWEKHLREKRDDVTCKRCESEMQVFRSTHTHKSTGLPFHIRHKMVPMYFNPTK